MERKKNGIISDEERAEAQQKVESFLQEEEERERSFLENSLVGIAISDGADVLYGNSTFLHIFGVNDFSEFTQKPLYEYCTAESREYLLKRIENQKKGILNSPLYFLEVVHRNAQIKTLRVETSFVEKKGKRLCQSYYFDVSEQVHAQRKLKKSEENLKEVNLTKDRFFSIIAHDLKNPFHTLLGFSDLLLKQYDVYDDEKKKNIIKILIESSRRGYELLENLLTWSRAERNTIAFNPTKLDLKPVLLANIRLLQSSAEKKNIEIHSHIEQSYHILVDRNMIDSIFRNLISNAVKFTGEGGRIDIFVQEVNKKDTKYIEIIVEDNGVGMTPEELKKLFRLDAHFSKMGTNQEKGTGLGLMLCKEFINRNKGVIEVDSEPGRGSKFLIMFPRAE